MKFSKLTALTHKWISLFIGVQIVLWITGGVVMSWFHISNVRGEHNIVEHEPQVLNGATLVNPSLILDQIKSGVSNLQLTHWLDTPVYVAHLADGARVMFDAKTGVKIDRINDAIAKRVALADFAGQAGDVEVSSLSAHNGEYRGRVPVWRIALGDGEDTRIYVSPEDGRVVARRNSTWRLYDFFWMLHIMDYENRTDFNNWLVKIASAIGLFAALSGFILLFYRFRKRDFRKLVGKG